jgi:hypothetical protein
MNDINETVVYIVFLNGIYDIICGLNILFSPDTMLAQLHPTVFKQQYHTNSFVRRLLAYWVITYGMIRTTIVHDNLIIRQQTALTYFIEAYAFAFESIVHESTIRYKALWIVTISSVLGICLT